MSPTRVAVDDDEQQIADMLKQVRRLRSRLASVTPRGGHDTFTAAATPATTYQLSVIPILGTCLMALNGHVQREGTDYSVDYSTGVVTVSATQASGDKVVFRYLITDWLVARTLPIENGIFDTFDRANSTTTINPRSDGGTWTVGSGVTAGILSNEGYIISGTNPIYADLGSLSTDVTITDTRANTFSFSYLFFAYDDGLISGLADGFALEFDSSSTHMRIVDTRTLTTRYTVTGVTAWTAGTTTLRVTYAYATSTITVYQNGTQIWQQVGATGPTHTGSSVGFKSIGNYSSTGETFNNFAAVAL